MNWVKSNRLIIVLSVIALAALPVMYYFSSKMSKKLREQVSSEVSKDWNEISNSKVTYSIPEIKEPTAKLFEKSTDVNPQLTKVFSERLEAIKKESSFIGEQAVKFNEDGHKPLIEGLFPEPSAGDRNRAMYQFAREYIERWPQTLVDSVNARGPVDAAQLGATLAEYKKSREERQSAIAGHSGMDAQEAATLAQELFAQRIDRYRAWADQTSFYADPYVFQDLEAAVPNPIPPMAKLWDWQVKVWMYTDVFKAIALANSMASGGGEGNVLGGVVKRVVKITSEGPDFIIASDDLGPGPVAPATTAPPRNPVTPDMAVSITGRDGGPESGNEVYDVRNVNLVVIVAPDKLPYLFDALAKTNFMTVLDCDMENVKVLDHLKDGYYYGNDHVVSATLTIETVWLRAWTKQYMPRTVRLGLGMPDEQPAEGADLLPPQ
jgi:hypothetical protein